MKKKDEFDSDSDSDIPIQETMKKAKNVSMKLNLKEFTTESINAMNKEDKKNLINAVLSMIELDFGDTWRCTQNCVVAEKCIMEGCNRKIIPGYKIADPNVCDFCKLIAIPKLDHVDCNTTGCYNVVAPLCYKCDRTLTRKCTECTSAKDEM